MEANKILGADILDILFDGRNKEYGAYEMRKTYNGRLGRAMGVMGLLIVVLFMSGFVGRHGGKKATPVIVIDDSLMPIADPGVQPPPPPPPPPPQVRQVKTILFVTPRIVPDDKVEAPPPKNDDLADVKIGTVNKEGVPDGDIVVPPADPGTKGVVEPPKRPDDDDGIVEIVQIESSYPGGLEAWRRYLGRNMRYPDRAVSEGVQGTVMVKFIVDKESNVSDVEVVSGPDSGGLREEAVRVIKKSGKWTPAVQNGRYVKSYKQQPVTFKLSD